MRIFLRAASQFLASASIPLIGFVAAPASAQQSQSISVPSMPLAQALEQIEAQSGTAIAYDPQAVAGLVSKPVKDARTATAAVDDAIRGANLAVAENPSGGLMIIRSLLVIARRDEAETGVLVRQTSTSSRLGQSLREQARNTQVISAKLLAEQQAQTIPDALRNAGGVSINTATVQGGTAYSVRGFTSGGVLNGLPGASNTGVAAGVTQSIANVERVEVLKGPDALLAGVNNLGGTVNIVTKKPSAEPYLYITAEAGSFGHIRGSIDATRALTSNDKLSARVIATAAHADENYGGYRGTEDYMFAPSIRYKDAKTDITLGITASDQAFGLTPWVPYNPVTQAPFDRPRKQPLVSADQGLRIESAQYYGDFTRSFGDWLTLAVRGQHQKLSLDLEIFSPLALLSPTGLLLITTGAARQEGTADALDSFARFKASTGPMDHTLSVGYTYVHNVTTAFSASKLSFMPYDFVKETKPPTLAPVDTKDFDLTSEQNGFYAQYMVEFWRLHLIAGLRHNKFRSEIAFPTRMGNVNQGSATTPNYGAVLDVTDKISLFASLAFGYTPVFTLDRNRERLPDTESRNLEFGVKADLFNDRLFFTGSWFRLKQSNVIITDPTDRRFQIAVPGMLSTGFDIGLNGEPLKGWTLQASLTRTDYSFLNSNFGSIVPGQARDQYSVYSSYRKSLADNITAGIGAGVFGRSSASVDSRETYRVPASFQVDMNGFLKIGALDVNLGVRNLFDRQNYGITFTQTYLPLSEPRSWRLTLGYRFY